MGSNLYLYKCGHYYNRLVQRTVDYTKYVNNYNYRIVKALIEWHKAIFFSF